MSSPPAEAPPLARKPGGKPKFNKLKLIKRTSSGGGASQGDPLEGLPADEPALDVLNFFDRSKESYVPQRKSRKRSPDPGGSEVPSPKKECVEGNYSSSSDGESQGRRLARQNRRAPLVHERHSAPSGSQDGRGKAAITICDGDSDSDNVDGFLSPPLPPPPRRPSPSPSAATAAAAAAAGSASSNSRPAPAATRAHGDTPAAGPPAQPTDSREAVPNYEARMRARLRTRTSTAPIVNILVNSPIDNTKPLIIKRRLDQTLREVRQHWCKAQGFSATQTADVFLVWKGIRVSDFNSCKGIGVSIDSDGNPDASTGGVVRGNIHLEAVTEPILQQLRRDEAEAGDGDGDGDEEEEGEMLRLVFKTKDKDSHNIRARLTTTIGALVETYKAVMDLGADQRVVLYFEGAILSPTDTVAEADLEDLCMVDVHVH